MVADWVLNVIECQDALAGIIAPFVDEMDGNAATRRTFVIEQGIDKRSNLAQSQASARKVLREEADAAFGNAPAQ